MDPISTTLEAASRPPAITETPDNAQLDKDAFLKLLVAQLKYQDPTAPTDVSEMMNQTSALSMVERLDQIAVGIEQMAGSTPLSSASTMLGREITFDIGIGEMTETVDSVRLADGAVLLSAGGFEVPLTSLIEVATVAASA
ncbi:MAG: flagellar hook capping FlgD N-terminal domain-containing protein, partial [Actinomycetota bacterium]